MLQELSRILFILVSFLENRAGRGGNGVGKRRGKIKLEKWRVLLLDCLITHLDSSGKTTTKLLAHINCLNDTNDKYYKCIVLLPHLSLIVYFLCMGYIIRLNETIYL